VFTIKAIILGIIQGLTEFIPVSSSGHLVFANYFLGFEIKDISFDIVVHIGTALAVIIYFRKDLLKLISALYNYKSTEERDVNNRKILFYLAISTLITGIIGITFKDWIESIFHNPMFAAFMLLITGMILFIADTFEVNKIKNSGEMGWIRAVLIGLGQAFAILPGISRSGTTITMGIITGLDKEEVARYSFLLSLPAILGAALLSVRKFSQIETGHIVGYILGGIAAFFAGYWVIGVLLNIIKKRKLKVLAVYCWVIAFVVIFLIMKGF